MMSCLTWTLVLLPLQVLASDHGVLIFGGEGPDGPVDTVSVLTENGWCPQDHVLLPSLPMAASGLAAYYGYERRYDRRPFIVVCGFPGDIVCYYTSLDHPWWKPMGLHDDDINLAELEFVDMFENFMGGGLQSVWRNKTTGMFDMLWAPGVDESDGSMVGWQRLNISSSLEEDALGSDPRLSCVVQPSFTDYFFGNMAFAGGFNTDHSLGQLLLVVYDNDNVAEWKNNSIGLEQPRSEHSCKKIKMLGTRGILVVGGFSLEPSSDIPTTLATMEFFFPDPGVTSDLANTYQGSQPMQQPRAGFGLAEWGNNSLVAIGGKVYSAGSWPTYSLLDSVELWDKVEDSWSVREEWRMEVPRTGFGIISKGWHDNEVLGSEYCSA